MNCTHKVILSITKAGILYRDFNRYVPFTNSSCFEIPAIYYCSQVEKTGRPINCRFKPASSHFFEKFQKNPNQVRLDEYFEILYVFIDQSIQNINCMNDFVLTHSVA